MSLNLVLLSLLNQMTISSPFLSALMVFVSGPLAFLVFPLIFIVFLFTFSVHKMNAIALTVLSISLSWFVAETIKHITKIPRPFLSMQTITPLTTPIGYSFPSEHAAVYATLAVISYTIDIRLGVAFTFLAVLVGISRVALGVHYPLDVFVGYLIGIGVGLFFVHLFKVFL